MRKAAASWRGRAAAKALSAAGKEAGATVKTYANFPATIPPKEIPDPDAFRQAVTVLRPGDMSPVVAGQKASYLMRLVSQHEPSVAEFDKEKTLFQMQVLLAKREAVLADWLGQLRRNTKVTVELESL